MLGAVIAVILIQHEVTFERAMFTLCVMLARSASTGLGSSGSTSCVLHPVNVSRMSFQLRLIVKRCHHVDADAYGVQPLTLPLWKGRVTSNVHSGNVHAHIRGKARLSSFCCQVGLCKSAEIIVQVPCTWVTWSLRGFTSCASWHKIFRAGAEHKSIFMLSRFCFYSVSVYSKGWTMKLSRVELINTETSPVSCGGCYLLSCFHYKKLVNLVKWQTSRALDLLFMPLVGAAWLTWAAVADSFN